MSVIWLQPLEEATTTSTPKKENTQNLFFLPLLINVPLLPPINTPHHNKFVMRALDLNPFPPHVLS